MIFAVLSYLDRHKKEIASNQLKVDAILNDFKGNEFVKLIKEFENENKKIGLSIVDKLKSLNKKFFVYTINKTANGLSLLCACSNDLVKEGIHCGKIIQDTARMLGGNGGGSPFMAQAGAKDATNINMVYDYLKEIVK